MYDLDETRIRGKGGKKRWTIARNKIVAQATKSRDFQRYQITGYPDNTIWPERAEHLFRKCWSKDKQVKEAPSSLGELLSFHLLEALLVGHTPPGSVDAQLLTWKPHEYGQCILYSLHYCIDGAELVS